MNVHYIQHVAFEGLGYIQEWLNENGHSVSGTHFFNDDQVLPDVSKIDVLIVMGGPMGVYDEQEYPWLQEEKLFITNCIQSGKKVLGICLGAQLLAVCLGADVKTATNKEVGWFRVSPTEESNKLSWFYDLFRSNPIVFHWHGDKLEIPENGSLNLLSSEGNNNQAFCYNNNVVGLQFHAEVTERSIHDLLLNCRGEIIPSDFVQTEQEILSQTKHIRSLNNIMREVLNHLFA